MGQRSAIDTTVCGWEGINSKKVYRMQEVVIEPLARRIEHKM